jgi:hypothetical protein
MFYLCFCIYVFIIFNFTICYSGSLQGIRVYYTCLFSISPEPISNTRMFIYFVYCILIIVHLKHLFGCHFKHLWKKRNIIVTFQSGQLTEQPNTLNDLGHFILKMFRNCPIRIEIIIFLAYQ